MVFEIKNKVALVTGGAAGIGLAHVKQLLQHGIKGVVIADVNSENGERVSKELKNEFGEDRVVFVKTDITDSASFENAFKMTLQHFKNVDILINNAGVCGDDKWEKEIDINVKGTINGVILGLEKYLRNHKQGDEAVILNISSFGVVAAVPLVPVYVATKYAILGLTRCWGDSFHFERTKVRVVAICPGMTDTAIVQDIRTINSEYTQILESTIADHSPGLQSPDAVAIEAVKVLEKAPNGSAWIIVDSQPAYEHITPAKDDFKNNILK